jgi:hypothetical protein
VVRVDDRFFAIGCSSLCELVTGVGLSAQSPSTPAVIVPPTTLIAVRWKTAERDDEHPVRRPRHESVGSSIERRAATYAGAARRLADRETVHIDAL